MSNLIFEVTNGEEIIHTCSSPTECQEFIDAHPDLPTKDIRISEFTSNHGYRDCLCLTFIKAAHIDLTKIWTLYQVDER